jgi:hypothetical protein
MLEVPSQLLTTETDGAAGAVTTVIVALLVMILLPLQILEFKKPRYLVV